MNRSAMRLVQRHRLAGRSCWQACAGLILLCSLGLANPASAQLEIEAWTVDAGGGTSVGGEVVWLENVPSQPSRSAHCRMSAGSIEEETTPLSVTVKETVAWVQPAVSTFSTTVVEPGVRGIWPRL